MAEVAFFAFPNPFVDVVVMLTMPSFGYEKIEGNAALEALEGSRSNRLHFVTFITYTPPSAHTHTRT